MTSFAESVLYGGPSVCGKTTFENVACGIRIHDSMQGRVLKDRIEVCLRKAVLWNEVKVNLNVPGTILSGGQQQSLCKMG